MSRENVIHRSDTHMTITCWMRQIGKYFPICFVANWERLQEISQFAKTNWEIFPNQQKYPNLQRHRSQFAYLCLVPPAGPQERIGKKKSQFAKQIGTFSSPVYHNKADFTIKNLIKFYKLNFYSNCMLLFNKNNVG